MGPLLTTLLSITIATAPVQDDTITKSPGAIFYTSQQLLGSPYIRGGTTPRGFDCSGFTAYVYKQHGIPLTRTAHSQYKKSLIIAKNNAVPGVVLTTDSVLNSKIKERLLQSWRNSYATIFEGARSPAILDGGLKIDKFSDINFQSLDFEASIERLEQDMAKAMGVPYVLMKSGNNANIAANQVLFYEHTILPMVLMIASAFAHYFNSAKIIPDKTVITALQPDLRTQSQYYVSLVNSGIISADEARYKLGFTKLDIPETSSIRVPMNITGSATNPDVGGRPLNSETIDIPEDSSNKN
jgi:hypothetical protein